MKWFRKKHSVKLLRATVPAASAHVADYNARVISKVLLKSGVSSHYRIDVLTRTVVGSARRFAVEAAANLHAHMCRLNRVDHSPPADSVFQDALDVFRAVLTDPVAPLPEDTDSSSMQVAKSLGLCELVECCKLLHKGEQRLYWKFRLDLSEYYDMVLEESAIRTGHRSLKHRNATEAWEGYWKVRHAASGVHAALMALALGSDGQTEEIANIHDTEIAERMIRLTSHVVCAHNDIHGYSRERFHNDPMNCVAVLAAHGFSLAEAFHLAVDQANVWFEELCSIGDRLKNPESGYRALWEICYEWIAGNLDMCALAHLRYDRLPQSIEVRARRMRECGKRTTAQIQKMDQSIECTTSSIETRLLHPERQQLVLRSKHFKHIDNMLVDSQYVADRRLSNVDVRANAATAMSNQGHSQVPPRILLPRQTSHKRLPTANSFFVSGEVNGVDWEGEHALGERRNSSPDTRLMRLSGDTVLYAFRERRGQSQT